MLVVCWYLSKLIGACSINDKERVRGVSIRAYCTQKTKLPGMRLKY